MSVKYITDLTAEYVRSILDYNPETGIFVWKFRKECPNKWNGKWAGRVAGSLRGGKYWTIRINGTSYVSHRLAWLYMRGEWPKHEIDHWDVNSINNKWDNLREATPSQNQANHKISITNTSGYKGVYLHTTNKNWVARIRINKIMTHLGSFGCPTAAYFAYCRAAKKFHGEFARVA